MDYYWLVVDVFMILIWIFVLYVVFMYYIGEIFLGLFFFGLMFFLMSLMVYKDCLYGFLIGVILEFKVLYCFLLIRFIYLR